MPSASVHPSPCAALCKHATSCGEATYDSATMSLFGRAPRADRRTSQMSKTVLVALLATAVVAVAPAAFADESRLEVGARSGIALPYGAVTGGETISDWGPCVPAWFDLGVRITDRWYVGGYVSFETCVAPHLPANAARVGLEARLHGSSRAATLLERGWWVGLGAGVEHFGRADTPGHSHVGPVTDYYGIELLRLSAGLDFITDPVSLGAFASVSPATFVHSPDGLVEDLHAWVFAGLRVAYTFPQREPTALPTPPKS